MSDMVCGTDILRSCAEVAHWGENEKFQDMIFRMRLVETGSRQGHDRLMTLIFCDIVATGVFAVLRTPGLPAAEMLDAAGRKDSIALAVLSVCPASTKHAFLTTAARGPSGSLDLLSDVVTEVFQMRLRHMDADPTLPSHPMRRLTGRDFGREQAARSEAGRMIAASLALAIRNEFSPVVKAAVPRPVMQMAMSA